MSPKKYKLMTPGPVPVAEWVLKELAEPVLHHRTPEFSEILNRVFDNLKKIFCTTEPCLVLNSSGTGAMEAAMVNTVKRGDEVLVIDSGKFGNRWSTMAQSLGLKSHNLIFEWGKNIDLNQVEQTLKNNPQIKALFCQASETSTGSLLPIEQIAKLTKNTDILLVVDGITSVGCLPIPMDEWGIDILISGSQKALMLPTGLSFIAASQKAWKVIEAIAPQQTYYWNLVEERKACLKNQTHFSSSVNLIRALDVVLLYFTKQGLNVLHETIQKRAEHFRQIVFNEHVHMFPQSPSPSLSCISFNNGIDADRIQKQLQYDYSIMVAGGQDQLKGKVLRIGHMGDMSLEDLTETAETIHKIIKKELNV